MHSPEEISRETGFDLDQLIVLATVLGYDPNEGVDEAAREMLLMVVQMVQAGLPWEGVLEGARVYADAVGRLADFGINMTHRYFCEPLEKAGHPQAEISQGFTEAGGSIGPAAEELLVAMYRYYMARALEAHAQAHLEPRDPDAPSGSVQATMLFVDLALFTNLADTQGDVEAMRVIDRFDQWVREYSLKHDGRLVKQIGDEFMLVFRDPVRAVRFAIDLHARMSEAERFVALRSGIHSGSVLIRMGDYYGQAVNIASRTASMAMPNAILVTEPVAKAAAGAGIDVEEIGVRSLRGMEEPLPLYRVVASRG
jgi:class 3 adenylate cyclase